MRLWFRCHSASVLIFVAPNLDHSWQRRVVAKKRSLSDVVHLARFLFQAHSCTRTTKSRDCQWWSEWAGTKKTRPRVKWEDQKDDYHGEDVTIDMWGMYGEQVSFRLLSFFPLKECSRLFSSNPGYAIHVSYATLCRFFDPLFAPDGHLVSFFFWSVLLSNRKSISHYYLQGVRWDLSLSLSRCVSYLVAAHPTLELSVFASSSQTICKETCKPLCYSSLSLLLDI